MTLPGTMQTETVLDSCSQALCDSIEAQLRKIDPAELERLLKLAEEPARTGMGAEFWKGVLILLLCLACAVAITEAVSFWLNRRKKSNNTNK